MGEATHEPGVFCWAELITSDPGVAKNFYGDLMSWKTTDDQIPGGGVYTMLQLDEGSVGGMYGLNDEMKAAGVPPHWMGYVRVEDAAAAAAKAKQLGGTVLKDAFDVMDIGVMAVIQDPTGATFSVWQAKREHGTTFNDGRPGSVCWWELATRDVEKCRDFYTALFGWEPQIMDMPTGPYTVFQIGETKVAGMMQMTEEWGEIPPHWMIYFAVADVDATANRAKETGAELAVPPMDIPPVGRFSVVKDPQGAVFSVIKLSEAKS